MAIAFDASGNSSLSANPSWTHTPVGAPKGVLVVLVQDDGSDESGALAVTYGGESLSLLGMVDGSAASEPGRVYFYLLASTSLTGARTVAVTGGTVNKLASSYTVTTGGGNVEQVGSIGSVVSSSQDDPTTNITNSSALTSLTFSGIKSGLGSDANVTADANHTKNHGGSMTGDSANLEYRSSTSTGNPLAVGWVTSVADDVTLGAVALAEAGAPAAGKVQRFALLGVG